MYHVNMIVKMKTEVTSVLYFKHRTKIIEAMGIQQTFLVEAATRATPCWTTPSQPTIYFCSLSLDCRIPFSGPQNTRVQPYPLTNGKKLYAC